MTGWRCGWALGPADVIAACNALQSHSTSNVTLHLAEGGARGAHGTAGCVTRDADRIPHPARTLHGWLTVDPRITCLKPAGAFYLFVNISELLSPDGIRTSAEFAQPACSKRPTWR